VTQCSSRPTTESQTWPDMRWHSRPSGNPTVFVFLGDTSGAGRQWILRKWTREPRWQKRQGPRVRAPKKLKNHSGR
jgi:hypothetical protein